MKLLTVSKNGNYSNWAGDPLEELAAIMELEERLNAMAEASNDDKAHSRLDVEIQATGDGRLQVVRGIEDDNLEIVNGEVILAGTYEELMKVRDAIDMLPRKLVSEEHRAERVQDRIGAYYRYEVARLPNGKYVVGDFTKNHDGTLDDSELEGVRYTVKDIHDLETLCEEIEEWALDTVNSDDGMDAEESGVAEPLPVER